VVTDVPGTGDREDEVDELGNRFNNHGISISSSRVTLHSLVLNKVDHQVQDH
jgi:hypothetical protein